MNQQEIAKLLGVSQVAVSLVLNNPATARVSAAKKARIIEALRENGFINSAGMKRTWSAAFITDPLQNRADNFIHEAVCGAEEECSRSYYNVIFECFRQRDLNVFKNCQVDGVIVRSGKALEYLLKKDPKLPMVLLNCSLPGNDFDTVMPDNRGGMVKACEKLLSIGCRNIAFLGSAPEYSRYSCNYAERLSAYLKFCRENGMKTVWENLTIPVNADRKTEETVAGILAKWEKSPVPPDAVITVNHPYGAMVSAMRPGLPVVAGDNKKLDGADAEVPFVLVQDPRAMGGFAAELLIRRINTPARRRVRLDCEVTLQDNTL